ncbi:MAG: AAA family ATPase [Sulfuricellaceae bacterium]
MYNEHFGLKEAPFGITPDTSFYYPSSRYQEALNTLLVAVRNGEGFIKLTGEVGSGKTLLCRKFLAVLGKDFATAYISNPFLEPRALLMALADELGVTLDKSVSQHRLLKSVTLALLNIARKNKRAVLCIDEAQAMPLDTLEALRLLTNLETEKIKLLQVVLVGQPELNRKLELESIRQLKQRITFQYHLTPLGEEELESYLAHRLSVAGYRGGRLFSKSAVRRLYRASGGFPRLINILAHKAMMLAYGEGKGEVTDQHIKEAVVDTPAVKKKSFWNWNLS